MALRLHNRRWYPLIFSILCATAIAAWLSFPAVHRQELLVSAIGGVAGFTYFLYRQHLDEAKLFKELFAEFNARYDALNDDLNTIFIWVTRGLVVSRGKVTPFQLLQSLCGRSISSIKLVILTAMFGNSGVEA